MNLIVSASLVPERWVGKKAAPLRSFLPAFGASRMKSIFFAPWAGASMTSVPARGPHADSANSAASRLIKNHSSNHDARYNDFAG